MPAQSPELVEAVDQFGEAVGAQDHREQGEIPGLIDLYDPLVEPRLDGPQVGLGLRQLLGRLLDGSLGVVELLLGVVVILCGSAQLFVELLDELAKRLGLPSGFVDGGCRGARNPRNGKKKERGNHDERYCALETYRSGRPVTWHVTSRPVAPRRPPKLGPAAG